MENMLLSSSSYAIFIDIMALYKERRAFFFQKENFKEGIPMREMHQFRCQVCEYVEWLCW